jgi:hypothetical protein
MPHQHRRVEKSKDACGSRDHYPADSAVGVLPSLAALFVFIGRSKTSEAGSLCRAVDTTRSRLTPPYEILKGF